MSCTWCESDNTRPAVQDCYWIKPDGKTAVRILEVPAIACEGCGVYVTESVAQLVDEALYWHDLSALGTEFTHEQLMNAPRMKNNYFK